MVEKRPISEQDAKEMLSLFGFYGGSSAQTLEEIRQNGPSFPGSTSRIELLRC